jgi:hypothetical protein
VPFSGMENEQPDLPCRLQHHPSRSQRGADERQVVPHRVDVAAFTAEVDLPVDVDQRGVANGDVAVVGPGVRLGVDGDRAHASAPAGSGDAADTVARTGRYVKAVNATAPVNMAATASDSSGAL